LFRQIFMNPVDVAPSPLPLTFQTFIFDPTTVNRGVFGAVDIFLMLQMSGFLSQMVQMSFEIRGRNGVTESRGKKPGLGGTAEMGLSQEKPSEFMGLDLGIKELRG
jgi:hypothetical protein